MVYEGPDRRKEQVPDGLAERSTRERIPIDQLDHRVIGRADTPEEIKAMQQAGRKTMLRLAGYTTERATQELSPVEADPQTQRAFVDRIKETDPRLKSLAAIIDGLPASARTCKGKVRTGVEIVGAIPHVEAFLSELATLKDGEFWELNEKGQLVMGDGCAEPTWGTFGPDGRGLTYHQSRTIATRICYLDKQGNPVVVEGDDSRIPKGAKVISQRGLVKWSEYQRKNKGQ